MINTFFTFRYVLCMHFSYNNVWNIQIYKTFIKKKNIILLKNILSMLAKKNFDILNILIIFAFVIAEIAQW